MTISSTSRLAGPFLGDGTVAIFPFLFKAFQASDLAVLTLNTATGALAQLALPADYTVTLNANQDLTPGGSVTLTAGPLATGMNMVITTQIPALQGVNLQNGGGFYPDVINAELDLLTILIQQLLTALNRAVQIPLFEGANMDLPVALLRAGKVLAFDAAGNLSLVPLAGSGGTSAVPSAQVATGTIDGANKYFVFTALGAAQPVPVIYAGGVYQTPTEDYGPIVSLGGGAWQIQFVNAPNVGPITVVLFA